MLRDEEYPFILSDGGASDDGAIVRGVLEELYPGGECPLLTEPLS